MPTDPQDQKLLLLRKRELLGRKALLQKQFGLHFYRPYALANGQPGPQDRFHRAGSFKHRLWEAGNRSGKSTGGVAEDVSWLLNARVFYPETDPARLVGIPQRPVKGLVIAADWDKVDEIFTSERGGEGKLWTLLPRGFVKSKRRNHSGAIELVECVNGSTLRFDTVKSWSVNPMGSESSDYDFIHIDEPCPEQMYIAHSRGLIDRDGKDWFTATLLSEPWIHDMFYPSRRSNETLRIDGPKWAQRSTTYDNTTLNEGAIADFEKSLTQDEIQCRMLGIPLELSGLVYKEFNWDTHVLQELPKDWPAYNDPPLGYTIYVAIDPHPQTPHAVLFLAVAPTGEWFLFDEIFWHGTIQDLSAKILARLVKLVWDKGVQVSRPRYNPCVICDPYAFNEFPVLGRNGKHLSMADEFFDAGLMITKSSKAREQGILAVKQVLRTPNKLYVSPDCEETLSEFTHWCWDTRAKDNAPCNKPRDSNDHMMENLYRLVLERPFWQDPNSGKGLVLPDLVIDKAELELPDFSLD